jgi:hypothetical protein
MSSGGCPIHQVPGRRDPPQEWAASWTGEQSTASVHVIPEETFLLENGSVSSTADGGLDMEDVSAEKLCLRTDSPSHIVDNSCDDEVSIVSTHWWESEGSDSMFSLRTKSSTSTLFDEVQFVNRLRLNSTAEQGVFMTKPTYAAAHTFCSHSADDYKSCPRCYTVSVREQHFADAVICVWCFSEGAGEDSWWFCWHCQAQTSSQGYNDLHYFGFDCGSKREES